MESYKIQSLGWECDEILRVTREDNGISTFISKIECEDGLVYFKISRMEPDRKDSGFPILHVKFCHKGQCKKFR